MEERALLKPSPRPAGSAYGTLPGWGGGGAALYIFP